MNFFKCVRRYSLWICLFLLGCGPQNGCSSARFLPGTNLSWRQQPENTEPVIVGDFRISSTEKPLMLSGYQDLVPRSLGTGMDYFQYERRTRDPRYTVRVLRVEKTAFSRLKVMFSDRWDHPLYSEKVLSRPDVLGVMSWCFFGRIPAGDMVGYRCKNQGRDCEPGVYHNAEKRTGKNINARYSVALAQNGKFQVFKGGMGPASRRWYRLSMGGGILLFDRKTFPAMYQRVGTSDYLKHYRRVNARDFVSKGQAGFPYRATPRSAMGILPDGTFLFVNVGEGKYRFEGGVTPAQLAVILKKLGAVQAAMFDGGGAPQMVFRNKTGRRMIQTYPEVTRSSNYLYNYAFLVVTAS